MSGRLRHRYQRLLVTYPNGYRAAHGDEILSTLLEAARPTQRFPSWREATSLLLGGYGCGPGRRPRSHPAGCGPTGCTLACCWSS